MKVPKGFISLGTAGTFINIDCLDLKKSYINKRINKAVIFDKFNQKFELDLILVKDRLSLREVK